ncbi:MAG TPA: DUF559 domain-containing protein [Stellaceae bacterium]
MLLAPANPYRISASLANRLWARLRPGRMGGRRFVRQHRLDGDLADFYCADLGVVVQIERVRGADRGQDARADHLELQGYRMVRVSELEMIDDMDAVLRRIDDTLCVAPLERVTSRPERAIEI